jgi:hypothetical protein
LVRHRDHLLSKNLAHLISFSYSEFLVRYFGSLQVKPKKIHVSLVSCLRNHRGIQKKKQQTAEDSDHGDTDRLDLQQLREEVDEDDGIEL